MQQNILDNIAGKQVDRLVRTVVRISDKLGKSEPTIVDTDHLRQLPKGTFGRTWIDQMDATGLTPFKQGPRRLQLHDGIHILTGYKTDPLGEAEVQAFLLGAKFRAFHGVILSQMILAVALFKPVARRVGQGYPEGFGFPEFMQHIKQAYRLGKQSNIDPDKWEPEKLWDKPFEEVRSLFNVNPSSVQ